MLRKDGWKGAPPACFGVLREQFPGLLLRDSFTEVLTVFDQVTVTDGGIPSAVFVHCAAVTLMFLDELQSV